MKRSPALFLDDILQQIEIISKICDAGEDLFQKDVIRQLALAKCLENIGEAVKHLDEETKQLSPDTDWRAIAGMRDHITHGYFSMAIDLLWEFARKDVPCLKLTIEHVIAARNEQDYGMGM